MTARADASPKRQRFLPTLFRTTAFKLAAAYLVICSIFAVLVLGYVAWNAQRLLTDQIRSTIDAEIQGLAEQQRQGGIRRLVNIIERRSRAPGASLYLVTTPVGERIAGNVEALPGDWPGIPGAIRQVAREYLVFVGSHEDVVIRQTLCEDGHLLLRLNDPGVGLPSPAAIAVLDLLHNIRAKSLG